MPEAIEPMGIFMYVMRLLLMIGFVIFMIIIFFSLKVTIVNNDIQRFNMELSDAMSGVGLSSSRSIFDANELNKLERETKEVEIFARQCEYGYKLEVETLINREALCEQGQSCQEFCNSACGPGSECRCNTEIFGDNFCECKKGSEWISRHKWKFGTVPENFEQASGNVMLEAGLYESVSTEFPTAISINGNITQGILRLETYDSLLTRLSCAVQKSYDTKRMIQFAFGPDKIPSLDPLSNPSLIFKRTDAAGTHVCIYQKALNDDEVPVQCRYMPDIPLNDLRKDWDEALAKAKLIQAYPLKVQEADCPPGDNDIASEEDEVVTVMLCVK